MYNFDLVLLVATKSQKDPKEFLPFLNELDSYEENYQKYKIDEHLKKYEKALTHIAKCGEEKLNEAIVFIERHGVYRIALKEYSELKNCYRKICFSFANYLRKKGELDEASIMYERAGDIQQAVQTAKSSLNWRRCLVLCDKSEVKSLSYSLTQALEGAGKYDEAFRIQKEFCGDLKKAVQILLNGKLFIDAIFECKCGYLALLGKFLVPGIW